MPTDEHSRTEYLRSLLNQQKQQINANGGNLLNPSVGGSLGAQAAMDTSMGGGAVNPDILKYDPQKAVKDENWFTTAIDKIFGFVDELKAQFVSGFVGAFEGVLDLAATGLGALGDATGWYDSDPFTEWAKKDIGGRVGEYYKTYVSEANAFRNLVEGEMGNPDFWGDMYKQAANILTLGNAFEDEVDFDKTSDRLYKYNDNLETGFGQFLGGAAHSIGFMLPSIMTGGAAGAAGATELGVKAATLASMGLSAAGKGSEEALNDGATAGKALAYGAASGAVEVVSEIVVGKFLGLVGLGTGKIMGVVGSGAGAKAAKVGSKTFIKELIKTMNEEGAEEIFSAVMEPFTKAIYKGSVDWDGTFKNADWWFGTNGKFNESVLGQYAAGAFVGGLMGGAQNYQTYKKVGPEGYQVLAESREVAEALNKLQKAKKGAQYDNASQEYAKAISSFLVAQDAFLSKATESQKLEIAKAFSSPNNMKELTEALASENVDKAVTEYLENYKKNNSTPERAMAYGFLSDMQRKYGTNVKIEFGKIGDGVATNGFYDFDNNRIVLNERALSKTGGAALAHEYFGHALSDHVSIGTQRMLVAAIKAADPQLVKAVEHMYKGDLRMGEEIVANFISDMLEETGNETAQLAKAKKVFGDRNLFQRVMDGFDKTAKTQKGKLLKAYAKTLKEFLKVSGDKSMLTAAAKEILDEPLNGAEKAIAERFPNVFDALVESFGTTNAEAILNNEGEVRDFPMANVAYSKELLKPSGETDSEGNSLTKAQAEFFKDSKVRDEDGNLMVMYHGTPNPGFTVFDSRHHSGYEGAESSGKIHQGREVNWFTASEEMAGTYITDLDRERALFSKITSTKELEEYLKDFVKTMGYDHKIKVTNFWFKEPEGVTYHGDSRDAYDFAMGGLGNRPKWLRSKTEKEGYRKGVRISIKNYWSDGENYTNDYISLERAVDELPELYEDEDDMMSGGGIWDYEGRKTIYHVYLNITRPLTIDAKHNNWNEIEFDEAPEYKQVTQKVLKAGVDLLSEKDFDFIEKNSHPNDFKKYLQGGDAESMSLEEKRAAFKKYLEQSSSSDYSYWDLSPDSALEGKKMATTRSIVEYAVSQGDKYDGVIINDVKDNGAVSGMAQSGLYDTIAITIGTPNQIKNINNENPTASPDIRYSKKLLKADVDYDKHPEQDPDGYIKTEDGTKLGLTDHLDEAIDIVAAECMNADDYLVGDTDYKDGYISKRFVKRMNDNADSILTAIEGRYGDDFSDLETWLEDHDERELKELIEFAKANANDDVREGFQTVADKVEACEYPNGESPEYEHVSDLIDRLAEISEAAENWPKEYARLNKPKTDKEGYLVDDKGKRMEFFHGSSTGDAGHMGSGEYGPGYYYSNSADYAKECAGKKGSVTKANIRMKNPLIVNDTQDFDAFTAPYYERAKKKYGKNNYREHPMAMIEMLKKDGYDGYIIKEPAASAEEEGLEFYVAFDKEQISAIEEPKKAAPAKAEGKTATAEKKQQPAKAQPKAEQKEALTDEEVVRGVLKRTRKGNRGKSPYIGSASGSIFRTANYSRISELSKGLLRKELDGAGSAGRLDVIVDADGTEYIVGAGLQTHNAIKAFLDEARKKGSWSMLSVAQMLTEHEYDDFKNAKLVVMSADGLQTVTVTENGEIINLLNRSERRGWAKKALALAIDNGGVKLDCYDLRYESNIGGKGNSLPLPYLYSKHGFVPVVKTAYDESFVDERIRKKFTKANGGHPVVFMKYSGSAEPVFSSMNNAQNYIDKMMASAKTFEEGERIRDSWDVDEHARNATWYDDKLEHEKAEKERELIEEQKAKAKNAQPAEQEKASSEPAKETEQKKAEPKPEKAKAPAPAAPASSAPATPAKPTKEYFKAIETTRDIVSEAGDLIADSLGGGTKDYRIVYPKDFRETSSKAFTQINAVKDTAKEAARLLKVLSDSYIEERLEDGTYAELGVVRDLLTPADESKLASAFEGIIKSAPDTEARSAATRSLEMQLNRAIDKLRDAKRRISRTRVLTNQRNTIRDMIGRYAEVTDDLRAKEGLNTLLQPFAELHGAAEDAFMKKGFAANLRAALEWYSDENMSDATKWSGIPFDPEVRQALVDVYESLGESESGSLSTRTMVLSTRAINVIRRLISKMRSDYVTKIRPAVDQSYAAIQSSDYRKKTNLIAKLFRMYKRGFAPAYIVLNQMLGETSTLARTLTFDMQKAINDAALYRGGYGDAINRKLKELKIKKTLERKRFTIGGKSLTADQAMFLWNALNVTDNYNAINETGITYYDENGNLAKVSEVGNAAGLKEEVAAVLPDEYKKMAEFLLSTMNDSVKSEYMRMYEDRYGKYNHRNEIGKVGENSYWMLFRSYERITNAEKAVKNPAGMFSHAIKRVNNENAVVVAGALSSFTTYIDQLARELYVKPKYREALSIMNTKGSAGQNIALLLKMKADSQDYNYLTNTLSDILGSNQFDKGSDIFSKAISAYSVAKLSLNIGTMLKQFASIWTSNIPMTKSVKGVFSNIFKSPAVKAEYRALVDELGGLKYREAGKGVVLANADSLGGIAQKVADVGMIGISKVDLFTVSSGVVSLMHIAEDQYGYKIGTDANKEWVKENWTEFELSQIGGGALSKNAIQRGDYKQLPRLLFGFLQGANRAALGSQFNKIGLWQRNHKVDIGRLRQAREAAHDALEKAKAAYEADQESSEKAQAYMGAQARALDADMAIKDYERFKAAGGKAIPAHMAAGLAAQGVFIALINELMKHLRGKKDKDDWEFIDDPILWLLNTAKTIGIDWLPFVNAISSALFGSFERGDNGEIKVGKGYELTIPVLSIGNSLVDIFNDAKEGKANLWEIGTLIGDMTGVPAETLKDYVRGAIRWFDPAMADRMQSVLYGSSQQSIARTYQNYLDKNDIRSAKEMLKMDFAQYKTGYISEAVADKIARLEANGYDVGAKKAMTAYIDPKGKEVSLSAAQLQTFKNAYAKADGAIVQLMSTGEFQTATQEEQAALIKRIYDAYYGYAKFKAIGQADTKLAALLAGTDGRLLIGRFIALLSKISKIKATKAKSRKELVFDYLKGKGLSAAEKTLVLFLAGYGLGEESKKLLSSFLATKGMSKADIDKFMK